MSLKWRRLFLLRFVFIIAIISTLTLVESSKNKITGEDRRLQLANIGSLAKIRCSFETFRDQDAVQWSHGEKIVIVDLPFKNEEDNTYATERIDTTALLIIKNTTYHYAGNYTCTQITSAGGKWVDQNWLLIVQDGPFLESITTVMQTESIPATCCVEFSHAVYHVKYLWSIDIPIFIIDKRSDTFAPRVPICSNVSITAKRSYHNKMLKCAIANELNVSSYRRVQVMYPATAVWKSPEESTTSLIVENNTCINITCVYDGFPPPNITLQKYNANSEMRWINTNSFPELVRRDGTQITTTFLYYFSSENSSERLRCYASNNLSDTHGGQGFLVEVFVPAMVVILAGPLHSNIGDNVTITCVSYGRPVPDVYLQKNGFGQWETWNEFPPIIKNATTTNPLQLIWEFHLEVKNADTGQYRCHANNTLDTFHHSSAFSLEISISISTFIKENIQTAVSLLIGVLVIIIVIAMAICQRSNASRHVRPTVRRYRGIIRNSLHFGNDSSPIPNVPDVCRNVTPLPPDTRNIPVSDRGIRDELLETYEELQEKDDNKEEQLVNPLLSNERINYAVVLKKSTRIDQQKEMKNENADVTFNQCEESASYSVLRPKH